MSPIKKDIPTFKCVITGRAGCGKTNLIQSHLTGAFDQNYIPTRRADECKLIFHTGRGPICFKVWESSGQKEHYTGAECAIIMYDMSSKPSYDVVPKLVSDLFSICPNIPVSICANKYDLFTPSSYLWHTKEELIISVKLRFNLGSPFLYLAQKIFGDPTLLLVPMVAEKPPYAPITKDQRLRILLMELPEPPKEDDDDYYNHVIETNTEYLTLKFLESPREGSELLISDSVISPEEHIGRKTRKTQTAFFPTPNYF